MKDYIFKKSYIAFLYNENNLKSFQINITVRLPCDVHVISISWQLNNISQILVVIIISTNTQNFKMVINHPEIDMTYISSWINMELSVPESSEENKKSRLFHKFFKLYPTKWNKKHDTPN